MTQNLPSAGHQSAEASPSVAAVGFLDPLDFEGLPTRGSLLLELDGMVLRRWNASAC